MDVKFGICLNKFKVTFFEPEWIYMSDLRWFVKTAQKLSHCHHLSLDLMFTEIFSAHLQLNVCLSWQTNELNKRLINSGFIDFLFTTASRYQ